MIFLHFVSFLFTFFVLCFLLFVCVSSRLFCFRPLLSIFQAIFWGGGGGGGGVGGGGAGWGGGSPSTYLSLCISVEIPFVCFIQPIFLWFLDLRSQINSSEQNEWPHLTLGQNCPMFSIHRFFFSVAMIGWSAATVSISICSFAYDVGNVRCTRADENALCTRSLVLASVRGYRHLLFMQTRTLRPQ